MFGRKKREDTHQHKTHSRLIQEKNGRRLDYVEMELSKPIKPAKHGVRIIPSDKFE